MNPKEKEFLAIIDQHKGIIYKITNAYCKNPSDRNDLIQEIIIQLWLNLEKYNNQFKLSTWIYRIALNTSISFYRTNKQRRTKTTELTPIFESVTSESNNNDLDENIAKLNQLIQSLKEIDKALLLLHLDGLSNIEIGKIMQLSMSNVSTKLYRIRKQLTNKFQQLKN